jgi:hypothetical protein
MNKTILKIISLLPIFACFTNAAIQFPQFPQAKEDITSQLSYGAFAGFRTLVYTYILQLNVVFVLLLEGIIYFASDLQRQYQPLVSIGSTAIFLLVTCLLSFFKFAPTALVATTPYLTMISSSFFVNIVFLGILFYVLHKKTTLADLNSLNRRYADQVLFYTLWVFALICLYSSSLEARTFVSSMNNLLSGTSISDIITSAKYEFNVIFSNIASTFNSLGDIIVNGWSSFTNLFASVSKSK